MRGNTSTMKRTSSADAQWRNQLDWWSRCICCRDRPPSWHDWGGVPVGTVRERPRRLRTPLPAATLRGTGGSARPALPAPRAGTHQLRPAAQLSHKTVLRYCSAQPELGDREGQASAHRAATSRQANGYASVRMYAPYLARVAGTITALGSLSRGWKYFNSVQLIFCLFRRFTTTNHFTGKHWKINRNKITYNTTIPTDNTWKVSTGMEMKPKETGKTRNLYVGKICT
jgi:hypothetical protein